ncbi:uncharacterized protein LOC126842387 [Adelges cooleyi]|uniref:uncharacterized protein LOC126842387 n=1 Tax=Adelges cooleyi TaxID=133065 RepID=UPI00218091CE|nr:uncharacterized protein LOC126842387 [Adelges cooleyi]XP_050435305.1 uncharacterized protein LOC126842387 [Adelges cooleyi]XP_050435306.1 uncharacterized protein LOC126842387 [Adelges cooleyi]
MKLFCFLTSFVFVNVSTDQLTDYKREVIITNAHIELAYNMNNITVGNKIVANGLEHVIKQIVVDVDYEANILGFQLSDIVFENIMFTVPECFEYLYILEEAIEIQKALQKVITDELGIAVPNIQNQNFGDLVLSQLGKERRRITLMALSNMLSHALGFGNMTHLIEQRRMHTTGGIKNRIVRTVADIHNQELSILGMCRLIALFISTNLPTSYIKNLKTGDKKTCFLYDKITEYKIYRDFDGVWWQVNDNDIDDKLQPLMDQL